MTIVVVFVIAVTSSIFILMYRSEISQSSDILRQALNSGSFDRPSGDGISPSPENKFQPSDEKFRSSKDAKSFLNTDNPPKTYREKKRPTEQENNMLRNTFIVSVSEDGSLSVQYMINETVSYSEIQTAIDSISASGKESGIISISGIEYRFQSRLEGKGRQLYAFLDRSIEKTTLRNLSFILFTIGCGSIGMMFFISLILSKWAVKPINTAWEKQKQFVADASHELKTPLTVIEANTDAVLANPDDTVEHQKKWLLYIKSETQRMSKLVQNLLYIARVDAAKEKFIIQNMDISEVITGVCLVWESLVFESGRLLETNITPDLKIKGDTEKIRQLAAILIDNAVKHSAEGSIICVSLSHDKLKGRVRLTVSSIGEQIPKEYCEKIFERFCRIDSSRSRETGGSGLGLSIAKSIMDAHNGTIQVTSNLDGFTSFIALL